MTDARCHEDRCKVLEVELAALKAANAIERNKLAVAAQEVCQLAETVVRKDAQLAEQEARAARLEVMFSFFFRRSSSRFPHPPSCLCRTRSALFTQPQAENCALKKECASLEKKCHTLAEEYRIAKAEERELCKEKHALEGCIREQQVKITHLEGQLTCAQKEYHARVDKVIEVLSKPFP